MKTGIYVLLFVVIFTACNNTLMSQSDGVRTKTGIEVLTENNFKMLSGKRVGLITNPTGVNAHLKSTTDILHEAPQVELVALYGPEHGVRGNFSAGDHVDNNVDEKTGVKIFSLYGKNRKPSAEMLKGIDVLVYDIQDIGARSYTYISTMGLAMEAAAENNIEFVVLDRPNPLGGNRIEGALVEEGYISFVSQFPIPYIYGFTPGELAVYLNEEGLLKGGLKCKLNVVKMQNWKRDMIFEDTGLPWVPTSPHIPRKNSAFFYAVSGILGELDANMIGVGYTLPFEIFALPELDADKLVEKMNAFDMQGVLFRPIHFKPYYMKKKGVEHSGIQVYITDFEKVALTPIQFRFAEAVHSMIPDSSMFDNESRHAMFDKVAGSNKIRERFTKNFKYDDIKADWEKPAKEFRKKAEPYYLYF